MKTRLMPRAVAKRKSGTAAPGVKRRGGRGASWAARRARRRGVSLIEFALVMPVLLTLVIGIMEFGWLTKNTLVLANATREGGRTASLGRTTSNIQTRIANSSKPLSLAGPEGSIVMQYSADDGATYLAWPADANGKNGAPVGSMIRIATTAPHRTLTGFFPFLRGRRLQTYVTMRREL